MQQAQRAYTTISFGQWQCGREQRGWHTPASHDPETRGDSGGRSRREHVWVVVFGLRHFSAIMQHHMTLGGLCDRRGLGDGAALPDMPRA